MIGSFDLYVTPYDERHCRRSYRRYATEPSHLQTRTIAASAAIFNSGINACRILNVFSIPIYFEVVRFILYMGWSWNKNIITLCVLKIFYLCIEYGSIRTLFKSVEYKLDDLFFISAQAANVIFNRRLNYCRSTGPNFDGAHYFNTLAFIR